ncbi:MAG: hypothetical protein ACT4PE_15450 [Candidatus Eiseniibacteriota bacterium]
MSGTILRPSVLLLGVFALSRAAVAAAGVRFDPGLLPLNQYLDPDLLRGDLARSLWHLHMQPPLFNLLLGIGVKISPERPDVVFRMVFLALGAASALAMHAALRRLGAGAFVAFALAAVTSCAPSTVLYQNHLFYTHPVVALLVVDAWLLHRFASGWRVRDGLAFFAVLAVVALTRAMFHLVWLAGAALLIAAASRRPRIVLVAAAGPIAVVALWYARTWVLFGSFAASTWFGMNLANVTLQMTPLEERAELVREGRLSPYALREPFEPFHRYRHVQDAAAPTGVPALDRATSASGDPNYNHVEYVRISRQYAEDAFALIRERPERYLRGVGLAARTFFASATSSPFLEGNRAKIPALVAVYEAGGLTRWLVPALFAVALAYGAARSVRVWRARSAGASDIAVLFLTFHTLYVLAAGTMLELGENNRFRLECWPYVVMLLGAASARARRSGLPQRACPDS